MTSTTSYRCLWLHVQVCRRYVGACLLNLRQGFVLEHHSRAERLEAMVDRPPLSSRRRTLTVTLTRTITLNLPNPEQVFKGPLAGVPDPDDAGSTCGCDGSHHHPLCRRLLVAFEVRLDPPMSSVPERALSCQDKAGNARQKDPCASEAADMAGGSRASMSVAY